MKSKKDLLQEMFDEVGIKPKEDPVLLEVSEFGNANVKTSLYHYLKTPSIFKYYQPLDDDFKNYEKSAKRTKQQWLKNNSSNDGIAALATRDISSFLNHKLYVYHTRDLAVLAIGKEDKTSSFHAFSLGDLSKFHAYMKQITFNCTECDWNFRLHTFGGVVHFQKDVRIELEKSSNGNESPVVTIDPETDTVQCAACDSVMKPKMGG